MYVCVVCKCVVCMCVRGMYVCVWYVSVCGMYVCGMYSVSQKVETSERSKNTKHVQLSINVLI